MEKQEKTKKKLGIYRTLLSGMEIVSNPIYKGPKRLDLVLDVDEHNKVITKLLNQHKEELSPPPEDVDFFPWAMPAKPKWMDITALKVLQTFLVFAGSFMMVSEGIFLSSCSSIVAGNFPIRM